MPRDDEQRARVIQRKQAEWAAKDVSDQNEAIAALLNTYIGRRYLWWSLQIGKVGMQPFTPDERLTSFQCGELNVGQQLLARIMEVSIDGYVKMQKENVNVSIEREHELSAILDEPATGRGDSEGGHTAGESDNGSGDGRE